jgi:hypothetical protein
MIWVAQVRIIARWASTTPGACAPYLPRAPRRHTPLMARRELWWSLGSGKSHFVQKAIPWAVTAHIDAES